MESTSSPGWLRRAGDLFIAPRVAFPDPRDRRRARLIAALSLVYTLCMLQAAITTRIYQPPGQRGVISSTLAVGTILIFAAYLLSRTRLFQAAARLMIGTLVLTPVMIGALLRNQPGFAPFTAAVWILATIVIASAFTSARFTAATVGISLAFVGLAGFVGPAAWTGDLAQAATFIGSNGLLIVVFAVHRDRLEADGAAELLARNRELEALKENLAQRVEERTAELLRANEELAAAYSELQENHRTMVVVEKMASLGRLTAGIAHEMNSPLAAVRASLTSASELATEYSASIGRPTVEEADHRSIAKELLESIDLANSAAEKVCTFVRSIRAQTRGAGDQRKVRFDVVTAVRDALQLLAHAAVKDRSRIHLRSRVPRADLDGDPGRIAQIVTNLVGNAIDANAERGGGDVEVEVDGGPSEVLVRVVDTGPGIPSENIDRIFDPLFTTKAIGKGTGLGLSIVHDIVYGDFGGRIEVASTGGSGATFTVHLPCAAG